MRRQSRRDQGQINSYGLRAAPMTSRPGRAISVAARALSCFSPLARERLLRTQEVGWRGAMAVRGLSSGSADV